MVRYKFRCGLSVLQAEVNYLGQLYHPHLVKLIGYCLEDEHRLLVYEFMPRGSLENHLFRSKFPLLLLVTSCKLGEKYNDFECWILVDRLKLLLY